MIGQTLDKENISLYQPPKDVADLTSLMSQDVAQGERNLTTPYREFNDLSLIERMNEDQAIWSAYTPPKSTNPDKSWRHQGVRPLTRNKMISIAAHVTASVLVPNVYARDEHDKDDEMAAFVMRDLMEYEIDRSDYEMTNLFGVISALINPVSYLEARFDRAFSTIKERVENGDIEKHKVLDEVLSGFKANVISPDNILFMNMYEYNLQKQRALVQRRYVEYDELEAIYGDHPNWQYLQTGVKPIYDISDHTFYDSYDEQSESLVEEITYFNRREDMEVTFINNVYFGEQTVDNNMMKHRTNTNAPKYRFVKFGYEPIDEKGFYCYKSAVNKVAEDDHLVNKMWQLAMDSRILETIMPIATSGEDKVDQSVIFPGRVTNFSPDTKITPLRVTNSVPATQGLSDVERSINESTQDPFMQGQMPAATTKAFTVARTEENARIQLGIFGKMLAKMTVEFGELMIDDILQHRTVMELEEILGGIPRLKFQQFTMPGTKEKGSDVNKVIRFTDSLIGNELTPEERLKLEFKLFEEEGGMEGKTRIYLVNPIKFSKLVYKLRVSAEEMIPKNEMFTKAFNLEAYDRMITNPLIDQEAVTRDFLVDTFAKGRSAKYMKKAEDLMGEMGKELEDADPRSGATTRFVNRQANQNNMGQLETPQL